MLRRGIPALAVPLLAAFTPFTETPNVCPSCAVSSAHVVVLKSGDRIPCEVVAQNDDFYVLKWHSEYRAAERSEVDKIDWKGTDPASLPSGHQIRDRDGVLYHGKIIDRNDRFLIIEGDGFRHTVWIPQIRDVHRGGHLVRVSGGDG